MGDTDGSRDLGFFRFAATRRYGWSAVRSFHGSDRSDGRLSSRRPDLVLRRFPDSWEATFEDVSRARLAVNLPSLSQSVVGLKIAASEGIKPTKPLKFHFVQRNVKTDQIVGGVAIQLSHLR